MVYMREKIYTQCGARTHDHQLKRLALYQTELTGSYDFSNEIAKYKHQLILEWIKTALYPVGDERRLSLEDKIYLYWLYFYSIIKQELESYSG